MRIATEDKMWMRVVFYVEVIVLFFLILAFTDWRHHPEIPIFDEEHIENWLYLSGITGWLFWQLERFIRKEKKAKLELERMNTENVSVIQELSEAKAKLERVIVENKQMEHFGCEAIEGLDQGFVVINPEDFSIVKANSAYAKQNGMTVEQVIGKKCYEVSHGISRPCFEEGEECAVQQTIVTGKSCLITHQHTNHDGASIFVELKSAAVHDQEGKISGIIEISTDITERKRFEDGLAQAQKMESVGQLAGGVAHDFNNILAGIIGYAGMLDIKIPAEDPIHAYVNHILKSAERAATLTQSLLSLSRKQVINPKVLKINKLVSSDEAFLRRLMREDVVLTMEMCPQNPSVFVDSGNISRLLMNLIINARDAIDGRGMITVTTAVEKSLKNLQRYENFQSGRDYVSITVSDTGHGMDEKTKKNIFDPFFTTKDVGKGTGLGLAVSYGIVKQHDGFILVESKVGQGTKFMVYLPMAIGMVESAQKKPAVKEVPRGEENILLIEDDMDLREMIHAQLEEYGYKVVDALDGLDGLRQFEKRRGFFALILSDVIMPNMNGKDAYEKMRIIDPTVPALFMSGYSADIISTNGSIDSSLNFIAKPMSTSDLLCKVRSIIDGN